MDSQWKLSVDITVRYAPWEAVVMVNAGYCVLPGTTVRDCWVAAEDAAIVLWYWQINNDCCSAGAVVL
jgi:hypothetical protein